MIPRPLRTRWWLTVLAAGAIAVVTQLPTTTNVLVDFEPRPYTQPLYARAIAFVDRDIQMRLLAERIAGMAVTPEEKAERILRWTATNIRATPPGLSVIDDHPYHIVVRGYGEPDQAANVLADVAAYAGIPGGLVFARDAAGRALYAFAVLEIDGAPRVFDAREGRALRDRTGALASVDRLRADPALVDGLPAPAGARGVPYRTLVERLEARPHRVPSDQMPLTRLWNELGRLLRRT